MGLFKTESHGISSFSYQLTIDMHHIPWLPIILPHKNHNCHRFYQLPLQVPNLKIYCTLQSHRGYHSSYIDLDHIYIYIYTYIVCFQKASGEGLQGDDLNLHQKFVQLFSQLFKSLRNCFHNCSKLFKSLCNCFHNCSKVCAIVFTIVLNCSKVCAIVFTIVQKFAQLFSQLFEIVQKFFAIVSTLVCTCFHIFNS